MTDPGSSKPFFDEVAPRWDAMRKQLFTDQVRDVALRFAMVLRGKRAADIGAGTGFMTEALLAKGLSVVAVDESETMVAQVRAKFAGRPVEARVGESRRLPLDDGEVDYAFANMYLHHVPTPPDAIREMARVVKPGGRVVLTDMDAHDHDWLRAAHHDRWMGFAREDVQGWMEAAGLRPVGVDGTGQTCCAENPASHEEARVSVFCAVGVKPKAALPTAPP